MIILILIFNILMASTFTFSKAALWYLSPVALITIRFLISGACLLSFLGYKNRSALYIPLHDWHLFLAIMLIPFYGAFVLDNWSLQFISSSKSCLIYNLIPLISAVIAYFGFKKKITIFQWIILFFGFCSLIPILKHDVGSSLPDGVFELYFIIEKICILCGIMIGLFMIWKQQLTRVQWLTSLGGAVLILIIMINARYVFPNQTISHIPELALLVSVALGAWGWLLIQQLLVNKNYNLLLVNGVGLFGAGLLSVLHLIVIGALKTMPVFLSNGIIGTLCFNISIWRNPKIEIKEKWFAIFGNIVGCLFILFLNFLYRIWVEPSFVTGSWQHIENREVWQPNPQDQLFSLISSVLSFNISYWITLSLYVGWLIIACHLFGYTLYSYLLKKYSATFLAFAGTTIPLVASLLGYIFLNESMPKGFMLSFALMTGSLLLFYSQEKEG